MSGSSVNMDLKRNADKAFGPEAAALIEQDLNSKQTKNSPYDTPVTRAALRTMADNSDVGSPEARTQIASPEKVLSRTVCPPTPTGKQGKFLSRRTGVLSFILVPPKSPTPPFNGKLDSSTSNLKEFFPEVDDQLIPKYRCEKYQLPNVDTRLIIKQASSKDCGAAASLMALADVAKKYPDNTVTLNSDFGLWLSKAYLLNGTELQSVIKKAVKEKVEPKLGKIPQEDPLLFIKEKLDTTGLPVITAITHDDLGGHWIVVDQINDQSVFIRDPFTGKAYQVPKAKMISNYQDADTKTFKEEIIWFSHH